MDETKGNGVSADTERTPLFRDGLGHAQNGGFGSGVVGLADVAVETGGRGDVDDGAVLGVVGLVGYKVSMNTEQNLKMGITLMRK